MIPRTQTARLSTAGAFILVTVALLTVPGAFARNGPPILIDGLISRIDRGARRIIVWEYTTGDSTWDLEVPGSISLRRYNVGDLVRVTVDNKRRVVYRIKKLTPKEGDQRYQEAIQRLGAETGNPTR